MSRMLVFGLLAAVSGLQVQPKAATRRSVIGAALAPLVFPVVASAYVDPEKVTDRAAREMANSAGARGADIRIVGKYSDPMHPGYPRQVKGSGKFVKLKGTDEVSTENASRNSTACVLLHTALRWKPFTTPNTRT